MTHDGSALALREFHRRAAANQALAANLTPAYDFIVWGAGSSGSVTARRLAENPAVNVLLIKAGGTDDVPSAMDLAQWSANLGSERDRGFLAEPNPHLNGRALPLSMGKALGGGSSIRVMVWARGHKSDWEADDAAWSYEAELAPTAASKAGKSWPIPPPVASGAQCSCSRRRTQVRSPASRACRTSAASGCAQARLATTSSGVTNRYSERILHGLIR